MLTNSIRELIDQTRTQFLPSKRDKVPFSTPQRDHVYTFRQTVEKPDISVGVSGAASAITFALSDCPQSTTFTALFDQYRITEVIVRFLPTSAQFGPSTSATDYPKLLTIIDYDDNTTPSNADELRQYDTCMTSPNQQALQRVLVPRAAIAAYSGAFTSYAQSMPGQWFDCASDGILHYGVKWYAPPVSVVSGSYVLWTCECVYTLQFRRPR